MQLLSNKRRYHSIRFIPDDAFYSSLKIVQLHPPSLVSKYKDSGGMFFSSKTFANKIFFTICSYHRSFTVYYSTLNVYPRSYDLVRFQAIIRTGKGQFDVTVSKITSSPSLGRIISLLSLHVSDA